MFLKSLTLKGFKSFADPVTLQLEPGITVVVGPNGSGKSNVVDAVAWVLGAQGPRTVRSQKMEDVIFAGSADRPALGRAEVSLTIDNRAGRLPGGLAEMTITRTLFRSGDSEYAINGEPCRLLDIQELLSDSGVGRQQHVIVGQGQLDNVLNARPEDRRGIIEEAAGVLKHRRRRERAERRLAAAEENLERLGDLLREVRRQMRPLERQAAAARSHAVLAEEFKALRLHLVGRELALLEERRRSGGEESARRRAEEDRLRAEMSEIDRAADVAAAELSARRGEELVVSLARVQGLAERARGLGGVLAERRRSLGRDLEAAADVDVVSTLEADAARLAGELESLDGEDAVSAPEQATLAAARRQLDIALAEQATSAVDEARLRRAEEAFAIARGQLPSLRGAVERDQASLERVDTRLGAMSARRTALQEESAQLGQELEALDADAAGAGSRLEEASRRVEEARGAVGAAEEASRRAEAGRHRLEARAEALERTAAEAAGTAGAAELGSLQGVLGVLGQLLEIDAGWGGAFEAAVGAAAAAVVVDGAVAARAALARLRQGEVAGAVVALGLLGSLGADEVERGRELGAELGTERLLRRAVRPVGGLGGPRAQELETLLDRLLVGVVVAEDWQSAADLALARPDLVVVTPAGDRLSTSGWVVGAGGARGAATAAEEAHRLADAAAGEADRSAEVLAEARHAAETAGGALGALRRAAEQADERRRAIGAARGRIQREIEVVDDERVEALRDRSALSERAERDGAELVELEASLPALEAAAQAAGSALAQADAARLRLEERRAQVEQRVRELDLRAAALGERRAVLGSRLADVERRLAGHVAEREQAGERRRRIEWDMTVVDRLGRALEGTAERVGALLVHLQELRARQVDEVRAGGERLEALRRRRAEAERDLGETRERLQHLEVEMAEAGVRHEAAAEALRRELGCDPAEALGAPCPELPEGTTASARAATVEEEITALGPVNPLALEELGGLEERHRFLEEQVDDVRRARRELQQLITEVDGEIMRMFTDAFADVNRHFQVLVGTLFPGGTGRLTLTEPEDLLDTGVEVEARPAGKNVRKLSLLSGGERSLVALAFLFAVFRSRPSPFYLMDEVEAALDDVNLHRFLDLLHEFRGEVQLIIVSHQKRTMEAADALYGVTMTPGGSSKVVSQKVHRPPAAPATATAATG